MDSCYKNALEALFGRLSKEFWASPRSFTSHSHDIILIMHPYCHSEPPLLTSASFLSIPQPFPAVSRKDTVHYPTCPPHGYSRRLRHLLLQGDPHSIILLVHNLSVWDHTAETISRYRHLRSSNTDRHEAGIVVFSFCWGYVGVEELGGLSGVHYCTLSPLNNHI